MEFFLDALRFKIAHSEPRHQNYFTREKRHVLGGQTHGPHESVEVHHPVQLQHRYVVVGRGKVVSRVDFYLSDRDFLGSEVFGVYPGGVLSEVDEPVFRVQVEPM